MGEFWDTHSLADYWELGYDVEFEIRIPRRNHVYIEAAEVAAKILAEGDETYSA